MLDDNILWIIIIAFILFGCKENKKNEEPEAKEKICEAKVEDEEPCCIYRCQRKESESKRCIY